jgi:hypothetical protein
MDKNLQSLRQFLESLKTKVLYQYFDFRINGIADPYHIHWRKQPYKILLILSHMRSGSSLFTHILNANPEIIGYGETHINYQSTADFKALQFKVYWQLKDVRMRHQYILDKILHDHKILDINILRSPNVYVIFLLREPKSTLPSILNIKQHWSEEKALTYYCQRLETLVNYAKIIAAPERCFLLTYDQLINDSEHIFVALKHFLKTAIGFSEEYQVLKTTGRRGIGDSSENIKAGRILKTERKLDISISPEAITKAMEVFSSCHDRLNKIMNY